MFPVEVSPSVQVNTLYDTGAAKSCMNYETFFLLGLGLDDKLVPLHLHHLQNGHGSNGIYYP